MHSSSDTIPTIHTAIKAARRAGSIIMLHFQHREGILVRQKASNDYVSEVDNKAEQAIIDIIQTAHPRHSILAEESPAIEQDSLYRWIIDPLDGTTNFLHGFPQFSVSIALEKEGVMQLAVIYDPMKDELFTAMRGRGAKLNDQRIRVSRINQLQNSLIGTGFPFREFTSLSDYIKQLERVTQACSGIRRAGSAALDLAYVAAGRLDGFWEEDLKPWDIAAGSLLIQEAGGFVTDTSGGTHYLDTGDVVAANPILFDKLLTILRGNN